ncbi:DUF1365 domain-containing protein [Pseudoroseicyclus aestuarii]|uniref:Cyclopropane-fatty-acyl-phospholipid synthase n=1 Tax=Pseudoroseicyclus aestuarii TaxID=1795041 RepID=A0A318STF3_9RHOB|nr:DUF1365 domain-containing protein [Pseudoroseicyclus aestuarii]PYE84923.1 hypothetical protein DFP88_102727 [Pseudoroseicyclus aestuarii]
MTAPRLLRAVTWHGRTPGAAEGPGRHAFRYSVDYLLLDPEARLTGPRLFARNRPAPVALHDADHGGLPGQGQGAPWARAVLRDHGAPAGLRLELLAQPRVWGHVFNPVSFWLARDGAGALRAVIAEVTNTYGDRHSYLCRRDGWAAIGPGDRIEARKLLHVSPFQPLDGTYTFGFDITPGQVRIVIAYARAEGGGMTATLEGPLKPLTTRRLAWSLLRRPFGSRRVLALIHWQALRLWLRGARFRPRPAPPRGEVSGTGPGGTG